MLDADLGWTLVSVFTACLAAGTIIPVSSEFVVAGAALVEVPLVPLVLVATAGNVIGSCVNYVSGRLGVGWWRRASRLSPGRTGSDGGAGPRSRQLVSSAPARWVRQWGAPAMVLSWLPVIGDALTVAAGVAGVRFLPFLAWVTIGKAARYMVLVAATGTAFGSSPG